MVEALVLAGAFGGLCLSVASVYGVHRLLTPRPTTTQTDREAMVAGADRERRYRERRIPGGDEE